ncbi:MAG TPA: hypothetical protein VF461_02140, partial [Gemmatimonadaceae bacterium]
MPDDPAPSRRRFLGDAFALGASSLILPHALGATHASSSGARAESDDADVGVAPLELPSKVFVDHDGTGLKETRRTGAR